MESGNGVTTARVTAIMPIHNEARVLRQVLDSIDAQTRQPDELILVFDNCTDDSESIGRSSPGQAVRVAFGNTGAAVRTGCERATHERLVLFDANTLVPANYVEQLLQAHEDSRADLVSWHGGLMILTKATLNRYGPVSDLYLWTLEYTLRVEAAGGKVVHLAGPFVRLRRSPLKRNLRYGLDLADLSARYGVAPFFRIGTKSGWLPDMVATLGAFIGHSRRGRLRMALRSLRIRLREG